MVKILTRCLPFLLLQASHSEARREKEEEGLSYFRQREVLEGSSSYANLSSL